MKHIAMHHARAALVAALYQTLVLFCCLARADDPYVLWARTWTAAWGPNAVAISPSRELFVDSDRNSFQQKLFSFGPDGQLLSTNAHEDFLLGDMAFDADGNRYLTGSILTAGTFGADLVNGSFVAKYDPANQLIWVQGEPPSGPSGSWAYGEAVAVGLDGNVLVGGSAPGATTGNRPIFCKYDQDGRLLWKKRVEFTPSGASDDGRLSDLAVDPSGNVVICGVFPEGAADFDGTTIFPGTTGHSFGGDWFIAKYGPNGTLKWVQLGYASSLMIEPQGNIYAGWIWGVDGQSGLAKLSPAGDLIWSKTLPGAYMGSRGSLARTPDGGVVFTGEFTGTVQFGSIKLNARSTSTADFFVAKADSEGNFEWAMSGGGTGPDRGYTVGSDPEGNIFLTGTIQGTTASFGGRALVPIANPIGLPSLFAAKLSPTPPLKIKTGGDQTTLTWPAAAANYVLEAATSLPAGAWDTVTNAPTVSAIERSVRLPLTSNAQFFRLRRQ